MREYKFYVPLQDNAGMAFSGDNFDSLESKLVDSFGGYTRGENVKGVWKDNDGRVYKDNNAVFFVASQDMGAVEAVLQELNNIFRQEAYYISQVSDIVSFFMPRKE